MTVSIIFIFVIFTIISKQQFTYLLLGQLTKSERSISYLLLLLSAALCAVQSTGSI